MKFLYIGILIPVQNIYVIYLRVTTVINRKLNNMPATTVFRINGRPTSSSLYFINSYFMLRNISGSNFSWTEGWLISRPQYKTMQKNTLVTREGLELTISLSEKQNHNRLIFALLLPSIFFERHLSCQN
jgi:hypothetical protein